MNASECRNVHILIIYYYCWRGGKRGRQERASEKNYHTQLERRSSKETSGCEKFIEHKIQKKSQENLRRSNLSGN